MSENPSQPAARRQAFERAYTAAQASRAIADYEKALAAARVFVMAADYALISRAGLGRAPTLSVIQGDLA